ncbi:MAG: prepilin-type N-terminal cleavage/methylation domain-containing protein [Elusimicrobiaceae bacterium]|nr:prepilin-type N-terminal cleavage/methylation domain-containing protein [Elusimicrobiaceae bacterium]
MKNINKNGFTLIELVVVILIVSSLAVIAVPQYTKAVERSKYTETEELLQSIQQAQERYHHINGRYSESFGDLDVEFLDAEDKVAKKDILNTQHFEVSLQEVNKGDNLVVADRIKDQDSIYSIYKNLNTGEVSCEDLLKSDNITCDMFGFDGSIRACSDATLVASLGNCKEDYESIESFVSWCKEYGGEFNDKEGACSFKDSSSNFCPAGSTWNEFGCKIEIHECPKGYVWNGKECVKKEETKCPDGYVWDGKECVYQSTKCEEGFIWNGKECVLKEEEHICAGGMIWNNGKCACPDGMFLDGLSGTCIPKFDL